MNSQDIQRFDELQRMVFNLEADLENAVDEYLWQCETQPFEEINAVMDFAEVQDEFMLDVQSDAMMLNQVSCGTPGTHLDDVGQTHYQQIQTVNQLGGGKKRTADDLSVAGTSNQLTANIPVTTSIKSRRVNKKYNAEETVFQVKIDSSRFSGGELFITMLLAIQRMFADILAQTTEGLQATDLIRVCIFSPHMEKPISTCLMGVGEMSVEKIMATILKILQSKDELPLDDSLRVEVITLRRPRGAGRKGIVNIAADRLRKKSVICIPSDDTGICCARSIVVALAMLEDAPNKKSIRDGRWPLQKVMAKALHKDAGVPEGPCGFGEIALFERCLNIQIHVVSSDNLNKVEYKGLQREKKIFLWLHDGHYDVITSMKGFLGSNYYCEICDKGYQNINKHYCEVKCSVCYTECKKGNGVQCSDCFRVCRSQECFQRHKSVSGKQMTSICQKQYQCQLCHRVILRKERSVQDHVCHEVKCVSCQQFVLMSEHRCFLKQIDAKEPSEKYIFFDFETDQSSGEHIVNYAVCIDFEGVEHVFSGYDACDQFCAFLFSPVFKGYTAIAHNMKGFDGQFILAYLLKQGVTPNIIPNGSKIMALEVKTLKIRILDSFNFLPMALSKLPKTFGLSELTKGYFPHFFNTRDNQNYIGPLPEISHYGADFMHSEDRQKFLEWYEVRALEPFNFREEMHKYCKSDVDILRRSCILFRQEMIAVTGVDPFLYTTIASLAMGVYRSLHIPRDAIAMVPTNGYINRVNFSRGSIEWLSYLASSNDLCMDHALTNTGEVKILGHFVDGFCSSNNTVYQYHGCFFHGCPTCFDRDSMNPVNNTPMWALFKQTQELGQNFKAAGFNLVEIWEHEFNLQKKSDPSLQRFLAGCDIESRLNPRDAFFGGRTNASRLHFEGRAKYIDYTSLYPWVNKYCTYPVGHPEVITVGFGPLESYFGIVKCKILPPRRLYHPVLPHRSQGKLTFPLCRSCVDARQQEICHHSNDERSLIGTWVTEEVKKALEVGYVIVKIYEVYHFKDSSNTLFASYIDTFLKTKQEASGWPASCITDSDKEEYIRKYRDNEGVKLDSLMVNVNPGRRQVAKLCLNSFWGRWGMRENKAQVTFVSKLPEFNKMLTDPTIEIKDIYLPSEEIAALHWSHRSEFSPERAQTNIFLAAFTTAHARLKLYSELERLGELVLYYDTDSIIFQTDDDGTKEPPLGNYLGDFTDELGGDVITTFVSCK